jgi:hypothetical protein
MTFLALFHFSSLTLSLSLSLSLPTLKFNSPQHPPFDFLSIM